MELTQRGDTPTTIVWIEPNGVQSSVPGIRVEWKSSAFDPTLGDDTELACGSINQPLGVCASGAKAFAERRERSSSVSRGSTRKDERSNRVGFVGLCLRFDSEHTSARINRPWIQRKRECTAECTLAVFSPPLFRTRVSLSVFLSATQKPWVFIPLAVRTYVHLSSLLWFDDARANALFRETSSNTERIVSTST